MKASILRNVTRLPNLINRGLAQLNRNPFFVYGKAYRQYRVFLQQTFSYYDPVPLLLETVNAALQTIPYYRCLYGSRRIRSLEEYDQLIGFIDKNTILDNYDAFINPDIDQQDYDHGTTGGTSGKPLQLIAPKNRYIVEMATMHTLWSRAGYNFDVRAVIRNHRLEQDVDYVINPITREVIFDGFRLDAEYFERIYRTIKKYRIGFIHCYPSVAYEFCTFLHKKKYDTSFIRSLLSGSENIFDYQGDLIQNRLGFRFYNWYGHSEKLILAGYCEKTNYYHVEPTYGYFELIDDNNRIIREPGRTGEMVGTGFHNPGMFFIRYRTGDFAEYVSDFCPACGRRVTLLRNIRGRWSGDKIYNSDGSFVTTTALNLHSDLYAVINGMQYIQEEKGKLKVLVIKSPEYMDNHEKAIYDHFRSKLKSDSVVLIEYVDKLRKLPNGKFVHIISTVKD
jgi:phenylacetate-CoA ligase